MIWKVPASESELKLKGKNFYLQYIADDTQAPHVGGESYFVIVYNFRGNELWCAKHHLGALPWMVRPSQSKVDDFNLIWAWGNTQDVLWLEVEVENVVIMHVTDAIANLPHEVNAVSFCQHEIIVDDSLK